jgi:aminoglycoside phosphotransferase (APT) family kinase protein
MLIEKVPGKPLPPIWRQRAADEADLTVEQMRTVVRAVGGHLRAVHEIRVDGYGRLDDEHFVESGEVRGRHETWSEAALAPALDALDYLEKHALMPRDLTGRVRATLIDSPELRDCEPRLLHGDLGAKHIFVDPATGALTGVIDWGDREAGDPAMDIANFDLWEDETRLGWLIEGYGDVDAGMRQRILLCAIADGLRLAHKRFAQSRVDAGDPVVAWLMPRIERALGL